MMNMDTVSKTSPNMSPIPNEELENIERVEPVTIQDASNCPHDFVMKGMCFIQCRKCFVGYEVSGIEEYNKIQDFYNKKYGKN
jgi:hypothetical protein